MECHRTQTSNFSVPIAAKSSLKKSCQLDGQAKLTVFNSRVAAGHCLWPLLGW